MVPVRALFCHQCSISVTLFRASPPSALSVFESISGKPARFCPNGYKIPSSRLKSWQRLLGWSAFSAVDRAKQINQSCYRYVISSPGNLLRERKCGTGACWNPFIVIKQQIETILSRISQTHTETYFSQASFPLQLPCNVLVSERGTWLPGQWPWCLEGCPPAGSLMDIIPTCGSSQWPVWWCWYRSRPDTQLLFMLWLAQVDGPQPQANLTPNPQIYSPNQSCF